ncbi:serine/threonine protein kinase [Rubritalea squalenifaciens DSM 18772]|uniref:Serine/threonine protein kinase n=1 Tax=Rubritalea squalenifaciens DSM 18772 TaxID=1123071 RepID=A0A1M6PMX7_9BACT|nr:serine/threonine-protein kinase [Rubritalea squalenifaciens]SHK09248.1 serine/threonine protein kinase [Rubritalea squalenifaciens DSM 18772]
MSDEPVPYQPDRRLGRAYAEANLLDPAGMEGICPDFEELRRIQERYVDDTLLGTGSLKQVWKCWDARAMRWIAMARLREDRGAEYYDLFVHEARIISSLNHPNIIKVYNLGADSLGRPFFTMDLKGDSTLADFVHPLGPGQRRELLAIFLTICEAIAHAHERGVLHLDLKPENIQVDRLGEVLVCDWGLAKRTEEATIDDEPTYPGQTESIGNLTLMGEIRGTPGYMAPEQVTPGARQDKRTDVFALGCILHYILTGKPPIISNSKEELIEKTRTAEFTHPSKQFPQCNIPESLSAVILKACAADPGERYHSAAELSSDMRKHLTGYATQAEDPSFLRAARFFIMRHRLPVVISMTSLLAIGGISAWLLNDLQQERQRVASEKQRAEVERQKAADYASEASMLDSLYQKEVQTRESSRRQLASKLARSANSLKNLGIFKSPVRTVSEVEELAQLALQLNPEDNIARAEVVSMRCLQLNFKGVLEVEGIEHTQSNFTLSLFELAKKFPGYAFSNSRRPTTEQLTDYIRAAGEMKPDLTAHIERTLYYDHVARENGLPYPAFIAFLEVVNRHPKTFSSEYEPKTKKLTIQSSENIVTINLARGGGSGESLFRFIKVNELVLQCQGRYDLHDLDGQSMETINVSGCSTLHLNKTVPLPNLKKIIIREGQISPERLQQFIRSQHQWEIIIVKE